MKRQRCNLQEDADVELNPPDARRSEALVLPTNHLHELLHKASLLHVDEYTLAEVLRFVTNDDLLRFCFIGNKRFASLFKSAAVSIRYVGPSDAIPAIKCLDWCIHNGYFPNVKAIYQRLPPRYYAEAASSHQRLPKLNLVTLPPSITKLTLKHTSVMLHVTDVYIANLSSLRVLVLHGVITNVVSGGTSKWLKDVIGVAKHLEHLTYLPLEIMESDFLHLASLLPNSLTYLSVDAEVIEVMTPEQWPPYLHTLAIRLKRYAHTPETIPPFKMPSTVTSLKISAIGAEQSDINQYLANTFFLSHPSQLHHLGLNLLCNTNDLIACISRLTSLKSLRLPRRFTQMPKLDYSLLPRSLTRLDTLNAIESSQWKHLPVGLKFKQLCQGRPIFGISLAHQEAQLQHLPTNITEVEVHNRPLPVWLPNLKSIVFHGIPSGELGRLNAHAYLSNLPSWLTALSVMALSHNDLFWLHNNGNDSSQFTLQFPNLSRLDLEMDTSSTDYFNDVSILQDWFGHLPFTLSNLSLRMRITPALKRLADVTLGANTAATILNELNNSVQVIDLRGITLPRLLETLSLSFLPHMLFLPKHLPHHLSNVFVRSGQLKIDSNAIHQYRKQVKRCDLFVASLPSPIHPGFVWIMGTTTTLQSLDDIPTITDDYRRVLNG